MGKICCCVLPETEYGPHDINVETITSTLKRTSSGLQRHMQWTKIHTYTDTRTVSQMESFLIRSNKDQILSNDKLRETRQRMALTALQKRNYDNFKFETVHSSIDQMLSDFAYYNDEVNKNSGALGRETSKIRFTQRSYRCMFHCNRSPKVPFHTVETEDR